MADNVNQSTPLLVIVGQTAGGKERTSLAAAGLLGGEIISCDSMKVYRGMDIGTAKAAPDDRRRVPHHCIDIADPWEVCSAARWLQCADAAIADIAGRGRLPIVSGGTVLYLKGLLYGLFEGPAADEAIRRRLHDEAAGHGTPALHERLSRLDPAAAAKIHPNDLRRTVRALEVLEITGRPISEQQRQFGRIRPHLSPVVVALRRQKEDLYRRIDMRVRRMVDEGFADEVRRLLSAPQALSPEAAQAVGYREMIEHVRGRVSLDETVEAICLSTRQFAKRQMTHLRGLEHKHWLDVAPHEPPEETARRAVEVFRSENA
jgi:tRNA dimethylallyltransferase